MIRGWVYGRGELGARGWGGTGRRARELLHGQRVGRGQWAEVAMHGPAPVKSWVLHMQGGCRFAGTWSGAGGEVGQTWTVREGVCTALVESRGK